MIADSNVLNWIIGPIGNCLTYVAEETVNAAVLQRSVYHVMGAEPLITIARQKVLDEGLDDTPYRVLQSETKFLGERAKQIIDTGFHSINSHALIGLWCALEAAIEDTIVLILMKDVEAIETANKAGYNIALKYGKNMDEDSARALFKELDKRTKKISSYRIGHACHKLLYDFGVDVNVGTDVLDLLTEINEVRNCLVHRNGVISKRAAVNAPSLTKFVDQKFCVTNDVYSSYMSAASDFVLAAQGAALNSKYFKVLSPDTKSA